jgi:hypothetical protein
MTEKLPKSDGSVGESASPDGSGRRKFIRESLGAAPIVLTIGNRSGWGGGSMHGTLWSSAGTNWRHKGGRWWGKGDWKDWDEPKPPHWSDKDNRRKYQPRDDGPKDVRKDARHGEWDWGEENRSSRDSDAYSDARADWEWYKEKERRRSESGKIGEKLLRPLEPPKRTDR